MTAVLTHVALGGVGTRGRPSRRRGSRLSRPAKEEEEEEEVEGREVEKGEASEWQAKQQAPSSPLEMLDQGPLNASAIVQEATDSVFNPESGSGDDVSGHDPGGIPHATGGQSSATEDAVGAQKQAQSRSDDFPSSGDHNGAESSPPEEEGQGEVDETPTGEGESSEEGITDMEEEGDEGMSRTVVEPEVVGGNPSGAKEAMVKIGQQQKEGQVVDATRKRGKKRESKEDSSYKAGSKEQSSKRRSSSRDKEMAGKREVKEIVSLALPALGSVISDPLMSLVDTGCIGQTSSTQLAALGPNTAIFNFVFQVFSFLGTGESPS